MSLIEEALRRLDDPLLSPEQTQKPPPSKPSSPPLAPAPAPTSVHPWPPTSIPSSTPIVVPATSPVLAAVVAAIVVLTVALLVGGAWWMGHASGWSQPVVPAVAPPPPAAIPPVAPRPVATHQERVLGEASQSEEGQSVHIQQRPAARLKEPPPATPPPQFILTGIVEGGGVPYAMINGSIVSVGEQVEDFTLVGIANAVVKLRRADGHELVLRVPR